MLVYLKISKYFIEAKNCENKILGFLNMNIRFKSKELSFRIYNIIYGLYFEYCIQYGPRIIEKNINFPEAVDFSQ